MPDFQTTFDASAWSQEQKNHTRATAGFLLAQAGITFDTMAVSDTALASIDLLVSNPSANPTAVVTQAAMESAFATWKTQNDAANAAAAAEEAAVLAKIRATFLGHTLAEVEAAIDADFASASNAGQVKAAAVLWLKRIAAVAMGVGAGRA